MSLYLRLADGDPVLSSAIIDWQYSSSAVDTYRAMWLTALHDPHCPHRMTDYWTNRLIESAIRAWHDALRLETAIEARDARRGDRDRYCCAQCCTSDCVCVCHQWRRQNGASV
jgi:hypothetical protein